MLIVFVVGLFACKPQNQESLENQQQKNFF